VTKWSTFYQEVLTRPGDREYKICDRVVNFFGLNLGAGLTGCKHGHVAHPIGTVQAQSRMKRRKPVMGPGI
jgi:hypothetical protein